MEFGEGGVQTHNYIPPTSLQFNEPWGERVEGVKMQ
jgi:hypothetical protein